LGRNFPASRALAYRARARELIEAAWRTNDISRKQHLFDLAKTYQRTADVMAPLPPAEPQVSNSRRPAYHANTNR
jgi:hypothetical protein